MRIYEKSTQNEKKRIKIDKGKRVENTKTEKKE
jgi:hypothetical protein